jgi:hypothetical protein
LSQLAEFLVLRGVVDDISHEGPRPLLHAEGVTFQRLKTRKAGKGPHYAAKKARIELLYATPTARSPPILLDLSGVAVRGPACARAVSQD